MNFLGKVKTKTMFYLKKKLFPGWQKKISNMIRCKSRHLIARASASQRKTFVLVKRARKVRREVRGVKRPYYALLGIYKAKSNDSSQKPGRIAKKALLQKSTILALLLMHSSN